MTTQLVPENILSAAELIIERANALIPTEVVRMKISEWAEQKRVLTEGFHKGPFSYDVTPYLREIADCLSPSNPTREVAVMKGSRIGYNTGILEPFMGFFIEHGEGRFGFVSADAESAGMQIETKIDELMRTAGLDHLIGIREGQARKGQRLTGDKTLRKRTAGGWLIAGGPNASYFKRQYGYQYFAGDETDADAWYIKSQDGSRIETFRGRLKEFEKTYKALWGSTPKFEHNSIIYQAYKEGDQSHYFVPCKFCGWMQIIKWGKKDQPGGLKFEHDDDDMLIPGSVHYECEKCGEHWTNADKELFLRDKVMGGFKAKSGKRVWAEWRPTVAPRRPGMRSFFVPQLYAPPDSASWEGAVTDFLSIKHDGFPPDRHQVWVNTVLGETYEDRGERPRIELVLTQERRYHTGTLPDDAKPLLVVTGTDIQGDRAEMEIVAIGRDFESWSIDYLIIPGDTGDPDDALYQALRDQYSAKHAGIQPIMNGIDAGYRPDLIYSFCDGAGAGVLPAMGTDKIDRGYIRLANVAGISVPRVDMNDDLLKQLVYKLLSKGRYESGEFPKGYCHFPAEYDRQHYNQLLAERRVLKVSPSGVKKRVWDNGSRRNEQIDCRKIALAMVYAHRQYLEDLWKADEQIEKDYLVTWDDYWNFMENSKSGLI